MRAPLLLFAVMAAHVVSAATPPLFTWATVPLFFHSTNESGLWSDAALERLRAFPLITLDKGQGMANASDSRPEEMRALDAARAIRAAVGSSATILFYQNSMIDWQMYSTHAALVADPRLRLQNASGKDALFKGDMWLYNVVTQEGRAIPTNLCVALARADDGAVYDGCFLDRGNAEKSGTFGPEATLTPAQLDAVNAGHDAMLSDLVAQLARTGQTVLLNNNGNFTVDAPRMLEDFAATETCIDALRTFAAGGVTVEVHAGYFQDGTDDNCSSPPINSLAAFLIGAGEGAYYACSPRWTTDPRWPSVSDPWLDRLPQYERPLGAPLANATVNAQGMWTRRFASGTNVSFNPRTGNGRIVWSDGTIDLGTNTAGNSPAACKWFAPVME